MPEADRGDARNRVETNGDNDEEEIVMPGDVEAMLNEYSVRRKLIDILGWRYYCNPR
jgi:hypothetical protein